MNQKHERRRTERIQRTRFTKQQEREPGERKHDRRSHNRCLPTNHQLISPYEKGRHNELRPPSATQSFYDREAESADEADMDAADYEHTKRSALAKTFCRVARQAVTIA